jgi:Tfp pilus assembly protein PilV
MMTQKTTNGPLLKNKKGYMLLEALVAIAIFAIGFMAVSTLVFSAARNNTSGNILTQANMFAREKMEELKSKTDLTDLDTVEAPETVGSMFTRTWTASDPFTTGTSRQIKVIVSWTRKGKNQQVVMETITKGKGI